MEYVSGLLFKIFQMPMDKQLFELRELFFSHYETRGMLEKMDEFIREGEMFLAGDAVSGLLDELQDEWGPELMVDNAIMSPISVYKEGKLVGIARNAEALMSVQNQVREKRLKGYYLVCDGNKYDIDENGHIDEPTQGTLINNHALEVLKELAGNK
jgi:hypothetical protein